MVLDIQLFRTEQGVETVRESELKRSSCDLERIQDIITHDTKWREYMFERSRFSKTENVIKKIIGMKMREKKNKNKNENNEINENNKEVKIDQEIIAQIPEINPELLQGLEIIQLIELNNILNGKKMELQEKEEESNQIRETQMRMIGNIVHDSVPVSNDEKDNVIVRTRGQFLEKELSHNELIMKIQGVDCEAGSRVAGNRGYYLKGPVVYLAQALQALALRMLDAKNYEAVYPPLFMKEETMKRVAQLTQFDEELYKIQDGSYPEDKGSDENTKYLIATSEQPLTALHMKEIISYKSLPIKYAGISTCFRKEAGRNGKDTLGIFRVHQFEKVEQFIICQPEDGESWVHLENMINCSAEYLDELEIPYRIVNIVSGELNLAAAKKYDIEGWFPGSKVFRELVSCSNCTDYHSRNLGTKCTQKDKHQKDAKYVHMLNATMCAVTRMICIILENYQTEQGIRVPNALMSFMPDKYKEFIPFVHKDRE